MSHPELLQPASDAQIRQFTKRLDTALARMTGNVEEFDSFQHSTRIGFGDGEVFRLHFDYDSGWGELENYDIVTKHAIPLTRKSDRTGLISRLRESAGITDETIQEVSARLSDEHGEAINLDDEVEGYIEHENKLSIQKSELSVCARQSSFVNLLDEDLEEFDAELVHALDALNELVDEYDIWYLPDDSIAVLDTGFAEHDMSVPSAADLIVVTNGLIRCGVFGPKTCAFNGASPYMGSYVPSIMRSMTNF